MKTWVVLAAASIIQLGCHTAKNETASASSGSAARPADAPAAAPVRPTMPALLFTDSLADPATGESGAPLPPNLEGLSAILSQNLAESGQYRWSVSPNGDGLLLSNQEWRLQADGFWFWKSSKQGEPVHVDPGTEAQFKSSGWIYYTIWARDGSTFERRLVSTDDPEVDVVVPDTEWDLFDANRAGAVITVAKEQLVVSEVRDRALKELHAWSVPRPPWAKDGNYFSCRLDSSGLWAALRVDSRNGHGVQVVNTSDGKIVWTSDDWCEVLWAGNAMFRLESAHRHTATLRLGAAPQITEERALPSSVASILTRAGDVSSDGRWALCRKRAPLFVPALSVGYIVLDMQTMRTYTGLSGFSRRERPLGWVDADPGGPPCPAPR